MDKVWTSTGIPDEVMRMRKRISNVKLKFDRLREPLPEGAIEFLRSTDNMGDPLNYDEMWAKKL